MYRRKQLDNSYRGNTRKPPLPSDLAVPYSLPKLSIWKYPTITTSSGQHFMRLFDKKIPISDPPRIVSLAVKSHNARELEQKLTKFYFSIKPVLSFLVLSDQVGVETFKSRFGFCHFFESVVGVWTRCPIRTHGRGRVKFPAVKTHFHGFRKDHFFTQTVPRLTWPEQNPVLL